jgi:SAM-dependent methyltransferase
VTSDRSSTSQPDEIAAFYDAHPYPPPVGDLDASLRGWDDHARRVDHFLHWPRVPYREDRTILIAGCGTSQAARWAARYREATVVGIDVSRSSLKATERLAKRHRIQNLELRELPIEEASALEGEFDQIICTGVLHHLSDPAAGLRMLRDVLAPEGALQLMVYAGYGRFGIDMLREYSRRLGVTPTADDLEDLRRVLAEVPLGHPIGHLLRETPDFSDSDALADALLNPREHSYSVPELFELLASGGMRFARWVRQAPYRPQCGVVARLPHGERIARMDEIDQYTVMELFRGTMTRHSLIAYREDSSLTSLGWDGKTWRDYVGLIPSTVVVVEDRLPAGMAAAVINRAHVDTDLVCFLTADELAVFTAIDAKTPLGEISGATLDLLERLWMHDLVVIDASGPRLDLPGS